MKKIIFATALIMLILGACTSNAKNEISPNETINIEATKNIDIDAPAPPAYLPQFGDNHLIKANAIVDSADLFFTEGVEKQVMLVLSGFLPTPCHELRVHIPLPDEEGDIMIEIYSLKEPDIVCEQVLRAFNEKILLENYVPGSYSVWINGHLIGNFDF